MNPFFSIIVPIYNIKEEYLRKCIQSALNQGNADYEIILVNDGSQKYCEDICLDYAQNNPLIKYIYQDNQGVSVARNKGIDEAAGEYIVFLDADDWMPEGFLESAYRELADARPDVVFYGYSSEYSNRTLERFFPLDSSDVTKEDLIRAILQIESKYGIYDVSTIWAKFIKRSLLDADNVRFIKGVKKGQDTLFSLYFYLSCSTFGTIKKIGYCYRKNESSIMHRYNENIIGLVEALHSAYSDFIIKSGMNADVSSIMSNLRISALVGDYLNLYFCHKDNPKPKNELKREYRELINKKEYSEAITGCVPKGIVNKVQVYALKKGKIGIIWMNKRIRDIIMHVFMSVYD